MTTILGYAELLAKSALDAKNRKRASTIVEQVHRVSDLIETHQRRIDALREHLREAGGGPREPES